VVSVKVGQEFQHLNGQRLESRAKPKEKTPSLLHKGAHARNRHERISNPDYIISKFMEKVEEKLHGANFHVDVVFPYASCEHFNCKNCTEAF
jgi:hypothetical protein